MSRETRTEVLGKVYDMGKVLWPFLSYLEKRINTMAFKFADKTVTQRYETEDGEDWVVVRGEITKKEHADLTRSMSPNMAEGTRTVGEFHDLNDKFFELVMIDWSLVDADKQKIKVSLQAYYDLDTQSSTVIDGWLSEHLKEHFGREADELEGEATG